DWPAEIDVSIPVVDTRREPGSEPPSSGDIQVGPEACIAEQGLLGRAGETERRNERKPSRLTRSPGPGVEPVLQSKTTRTRRVAHVGRPDANAERAGMPGLSVPGFSRARDSG